MAVAATSPSKHMTHPIPAFLFIHLPLHPKALQVEASDIHCASSTAGNTHWSGQRTLQRQVQVHKESISVSQGEENLEIRQFAL